MLPGRILDVKQPGCAAPGYDQDAARAYLDAQAKLAQPRAQAAAIDRKWRDEQVDEADAA
ncbi:MAG: hypothetical protein M0Z82_17645 [Actinomycetota bacterium]|jgi:hypothetical protein|nr:hypothetical protein [Actinomycetota bacterium]